MATKKTQEIEHEAPSPRTTHGKMNKRFDDQLREMLATRFGAVHNEGFLSNMYELALETEAGRLLVQPNVDWVAMRFVDVDRAKAVLPHRLEDPLNPHSGKYNSMIFDDSLPVQARLDIVQNMIEKVLPCTS